jgi:hypothetical protein
LEVRTVKALARPDGAYQVVEATEEEEAELLAQPVGEGTAWIEAHAEIYTDEGEVQL